MPSFDQRMTWFPVFAVPVVILICVTAIAGSGLILIVSLPMLLFKSKRSLAIQLIISALCTGLPLAGALGISKETSLGKTVKELPATGNYASERNH